MSGDLAELVAQARAGEPRSVGRLISMVENSSPQLPELMAALTRYAGKADVIGLTGSPGVGKSTTTSVLLTAYRAQGKRVGVLAIDPSSPFTGGALLGDRVRMQEHATDPGVYIRSMGSRGHLGGLSWATPQAVRVLDAAGCDLVIVETVGVGQAEVEVASLADTTVVLLAPGMGDGIQAAKAGILEVADVYVVNKSDRDGADHTIRDLRQMLSFVERPSADAWIAPIVSTVASRGEGSADLLEALAKHRQWLSTSGTLESARLARVAHEIEALAVTSLRAQMGDLRGGSLLGDLSARVVAGEIDPYSAADELIAGVTRG